MEFVSYLLYEYYVGYCLLSDVYCICSKSSAKYASEDPHLTLWIRSCKLQRYVK
jgi:hypothetical protein